MSLNLFPARVAIGRLTLPNGVSVDVLPTPELVRAFTALFERVGAANGMSSDDIAVMLAFDHQAAQPESDYDTENPDQATVAALRNQVAELQQQIEQFQALSSQVAEMRKQLAAIASEGVFAAPATDWEHPGKLGQAKANSARVTTLTATDFSAFNKGLSVNGPATLGATATTQLSYESPVMRYYVGDGTGYSLSFCKRTGGVTTDLVTVTDQGAMSCIAGFGCNGSSPTSKVTVTGSRGGNAAVASLLTAMASFGFIQDSTTA